ncbi:hypothetical protein [Bradyrhizobium sp. 930_D9_N1_4]|uniref:hypothetical protein n=1 Tax=Bradyrhizobium sp. 930_D9_N1_4 TaxID=3240374 RepID=UPI003F88B7E6
MVDKHMRLLRKLDRPPGGPNFARFIHDDPIRTAKAVMSFIKGLPPFNYLQAYKAVRDRIELGIPAEAAIRVAVARGAPLGRPHNEALIRAFLEYDEQRRFAAQNPIGFDVEYFRVSREIVVPISPVSVIRERGKFVPIFMCGWSSLSLSLLQRRLLMTMYEDAFFSLTDYQNSPAEILFFPKVGDGTLDREAEVWRRGDYDLLTPAELNDCLENFLLARQQVRRLIAADAQNFRKPGDGSPSD